jgi:hypothetical protein
MVMCQIAVAIRVTRNQGYTWPETPGVIDTRYEKYVIHHNNVVVFRGGIYGRCSLGAYESMFRLSVGITLVSATYATGACTKLRVPELRTLVCFAV